MVHKPAKSINPGQEDESTNIDAHLDHVNKVLKWGVSDLEKFICSLKARISAEDAYVQALLKIPKNNNATDNQTATSTMDLNYFGDYTTTFQHTTNQYDVSIERTIELRREFIVSLKGQMELLAKVKNTHEERRKKVKAVLSEKNTKYIVFRTREITKLHKTYFNKCMELASLQQQVLISSHDDNASISASTLVGSNDSHYFSPQMVRISSDEPRLSNDSSRDDNHSITSSYLQDSSSPPHSKKNSMSGFITQMRSQLANAAAAGDLSKQTARLAKLKKEITDTDHEYRQGVRVLEFLRRKQVDTAAHAIRHVEAILLEKSDAVKAVMSTLCKQEEDTLSNEVELVKHSFEVVTNMDGKKDTDQFLLEYEKLGFIKPKPIYYHNYYYGQCKDILFGSNLNDYAMDHQRTVPLLVTKCIEAVETQGGLEKEGIYRISGRQSNIDQLKSEFEKDEEAVDLEPKDVFTIASVLKVYLRELKQPLFNLTMQERIDYSKIADESKRKTMLQTKISNLSKAQRDTLHSVIVHLAKVEGNSKINKMSMKNLSVIFTPALFHDHNQAENAGEWYSDKVLEDLILQHESLLINVVENKTDGGSIADSPTSSVLSLSCPMGVAGTQASISRCPTVLKTPANIPNSHTTTTTTTTSNTNTTATTTNSNRTN